jgi:hypothetical protein
MGSGSFAAKDSYREYRNYRRGLEVVDLTCENSTFAERCNAFA